MNEAEGITLMYVALDKEQAFTAIVPFCIQHHIQARIPVFRNLNTPEYRALSHNASLEKTHTHNRSINNFSLSSDGQFRSVLVKRVFKFDLVFGH
ncbi:hypothetical protein PoB_003207400 [Plakobranchus ocellatus]|uniref:Uncharacterized protein n=1 Tax=Plakobranchus ocellatus TaxID=259542 RepID=A0AAV4AD44_9GAST|nr:hypothetical protein PoB_003207400 [Plakobranchus ocellatus]